MSICALTKQSAEAGTVLLCYSETDQFIEGLEYQISRVADNGFYIIGEDLQEHFFKSVDDIKTIFMFE
jgi:hypothetical protein